MRDIYIIKDDRDYLIDYTFNYPVFKKNKKKAIKLNCEDAEKICKKIRKEFEIDVKVIPYKTR